jgi:hypothetical protein
MKPKVAFIYQTKFDDAPRICGKMSREAKERRIIRSSSPVSPEGSEWSAGGPCEQVEIISCQRPMI